MGGAEIAASIDWSDWGSVFQTAYCSCGRVFRSHHKLHKLPRSGKLIGVTRDPCPTCGSYLDVNRSSTDPEDMTLKGR